MRVSPSHLASRTVRTEVYGNVVDIACGDFYGFHERLGVVFFKPVRIVRYAAHYLTLILSAGRGMVSLTLHTYDGPKASPPVTSYHIAGTAVFFTVRSLSCPCGFSRTVV